MPAMKPLSSKLPRFMFCRVPPLLPASQGLLLYFACWTNTEWPTVISTASSACDAFRNSQSPRLLKQGASWASRPVIC